MESTHEVVTEQATLNAANSAMDWEESSGGP